MKHPFKRIIHGRFWSRYVQLLHKQVSIMFWKMTRFFPFLLSKSSNAFELFKGTLRYTLMLRRLLDTLWGGQHYSYTGSQSLSTLWWTMLYANSDDTVQVTIHSPFMLYIIKVTLSYQVVHIWLWSLTSMEIDLSSPSPVPPLVALLPLLLGPETLRRLQEV